MDSLHVLRGHGDLRLTWNPEEPEELARARAEVERLRAAGYQFFLVDDTPADTVTAGRGTLVVRRIEPSAVAPALSVGRVDGREVAYTITSDPGGARSGEEPDADVAVEGAGTEPTPRRRGRRPQKVVATRPLRGGAPC